MAPIHDDRARAAAVAHCPPYNALSGEQAVARRIGARARGFRGHGECTGSVHERSKIRRGKYRDRWGLRARLHARLGKLANVPNGLPRLEAYMEEMYARPRAPMRIKEAFASIRR